VSEVSRIIADPLSPRQLQLNLEERGKQTQLLRRRQLHHFYVNFTARNYNSEHDALTSDLSTRQKALSPRQWSLGKVIVEPQADINSWGIGKVDPQGEATLPNFVSQESGECLQLQSAQTEQTNNCRLVKGVGGTCEGGGCLLHCMTRQETARKESDGGRLGRSWIAKEWENKNKENWILRFEEIICENESNAFHSLSLLRVWITLIFCVLLNHGTSVVYDPIILKFHLAL